MWLIPRVEQTRDQREEVKWAPLSEVRVEGTPNLEIHELMKTLAQESADVEDMGMASGHLVVLSMIVKRWVKPRWGGRGPTRSSACGRIS